MLASFIIGFHTERAENLLQTLRFLINDHQEVVHDTQLILVCQNDCNHMKEHQLEELHFIKPSFRSVKIIDMHLKGMHLPLVTNSGVEAADADKLLILESDRILPSGYFASTFNQLKNGFQISCATMKKLGKPTTDEQIKSGSFDYNDEYRDVKNTPGARTVWSGNTAITKDDYYRSGKMDEAYIGYGWADNDMTNATNKIGVQTILRQETELHLWHPPATYGDGPNRFILNGLYFCKKWQAPFPNFLREEIGKTIKVML